MIPELIKGSIRDILIKIPLDEFNFYKSSTEHLTPNTTGEHIKPGG